MSITPTSYLADAIAPTDTLYESTGVTVRAGDFKTISGGMDPTDSAVVTAVRAVRGSGIALGGIGQRFKDIDTESPTASDALRAEAAYAVRHLVRAGDIANVSITATADEGTETATVDIVYDNLRSGKTESVPV